MILTRGWWCSGWIIPTAETRAARARLPPRPYLLPLNRKLETGALEVKGFDATLGCRRLIEQSLEDASRNTDGALVLAEQHLELDRAPLVIPVSVVGEGEEHHCQLLSCSRIVL
jgi:hypothetical protein